jgi:putative transposase
MSRPKRIVGFSYSGKHRYFLTICTRSRLAAFSDADVAISTIDHFFTTAAKEAFAIRAYCLMPDHIHLLVEGTSDDSDLRRFVKLAKQRSGADFALQKGRRLGSAIWKLEDFRS